METWRLKTKSITKYNPNYDISLNNDWTSYSEIGKVINGIKFSYEDYIQTEKKYIDTIISILDFFKTEEVSTLNVFKHSNKDDFIKHNDEDIFRFYETIKPFEFIRTKKNISNLIKLNLREYLNSEIVIDKNSNTIIRFGFDYYMYINTNANLNYDEIKQKFGLFIK